MTKTAKPKPTMPATGGSYVRDGNDLTQVEEPTREQTATQRRDAAKAANKEPSK